MKLFTNISQRSSLVFKRTSHESGTAALSVSGLTIHYDSQPALEDISFELHSGERLAVVGPNGAGKSTLFKVIAGVLKPNRGIVSIYGHAPGGHICIAYIPQRSQVDWNFPASVADVVMMGRIGQLGLIKWPKQRDWDRVHQALDDVGLGNLARRQISELSGGQQQRMFIARALAQEAELMLMDEPLSGLDTTSTHNLFVILDALQNRGVSVMIALHDLQIAAAHFDRIILLNKRLIRLGTAEQVFQADILRQAYGSHLQLVTTGDGTLALGDTCCDDGDPQHD